MEEENRQIGCSGKCENCNMTQRVYCAAQIGLYNQKEIAIIKENQALIMQALDSIGNKQEEICTISALQ